MARTNVGLRYIGSKARVVEALANLIGSPSRSSSMFVDAFCGTGVVAAAAARRGWSVRLNDHLRCAVVLSAARLVSREHARFAGLGGYAEAVRTLNDLEGVEGFIWREYSPASAKYGTSIDAREPRFRRADTSRSGRRYFTEENAIRIDAVRNQIAEWSAEGVITSAEENLLLGDLLEAVNGVANIAGTYGCFLAKWSPVALQPLVLRPRQLFPVRVEVEIYNGDARNVPVEEADTVYLDPPYTKRQYAAYYHILETIAVGDEPEVEGITGLRPWQDKASDYCYRRRALEALRQLISALPARRVLLSYSSEGHISLPQLEDALATLGSLSVHAVGDIGRYRPNRAACEAGDSVREVLLEVERRARRTRAFA
ncbi:MAG TPA: DNA adenine methylase [Anaeromyxobacter sp.]|nr:DNA adenine methylase [Anaeromyxobacter sp.]